MGTKLIGGIIAVDQVQDKALLRNAVEFSTG